MKKYNIKIEEILQIRDRIKEINSKNINEINFIDEEGNVVIIDENMMRDFFFSGINNIDFIVSGFYKM